MFDGIRFSTLENVYSDCYIAKKLESEFDDSGNEITMYDKPNKKPYRFNIQPLNNSNSSEIESFGENASKMRVAVITDKKAFEGKFKEFDLAYLEGATPKGEKINGQNANYRIYSVFAQNVVLKIYFIKLV